jgi:hypothetical protein
LYFEPDISRKDAKALRFEAEICPFDAWVLFVPSRLAEKNYSLDCVANVSRKTLSWGDFSLRRLGRGAQASLHERE